MQGIPRNDVGSSAIVSPRMGDVMVNSVPARVKTLYHVTPPSRLARKVDWTAAGSLRSVSFLVWNRGRQRSASGPRLGRFTAWLGGEPSGVRPRKAADR